jgi:hypothetical protein
MDRERSRRILPPHILHIIFGYSTRPPLLDSQYLGPDAISTITLQSLRLASSEFNAIATPLLFHTIILSIDSTSLATLHDIATMGDGMAARLPSATQYVKCLCVNLDCHSKVLSASIHAFQDF